MMQEQLSVALRYARGRNDDKASARGNASGLNYWVLHVRIGRRGASQFIVVLRL